MKSYPFIEGLFHNAIIFGSLSANQDSMGCHSKVWFTLLTCENGCWTKNGGILPPKWMVKIMENPYEQMDDVGGKTPPPICGNTHIRFHGLRKLNQPQKCTSIFWWGKTPEWRLQEKEEAVAHEGTHSVRIACPAIRWFFGRVFFDPWEDGWIHRVLLQ